MTTYMNVICPFCGCACDDIEVTVEDGKVSRIRNACAISSSKFQNFSGDRLLEPLARIGGRNQSILLDEAVRRIAKMLVEAKYPLLYGWSSTSCEAQKLGVELAETVGGVLDNTTTTCHGPSILGVHEIGEPTCTLGEVKHRADLIIYWGSNPVHAHPRHLTRYTVQSKGRFIQSRKERTLIVVDCRKTNTASLADKFIQIQPNRDYELLSALRVLVKGEDLEQESVAGLPIEIVEELAEKMMSCDFGILFYGLGLTMSAGKVWNVDAAISLVRELNTRTKFSLMPMRGHFNVTGANKVAAWQTGFGFGVDFSEDFPRYNPGETTAMDILLRRGCDAALIVASDPVANLPKEAVKTLYDIPVAVIDPRVSLTSLMAETVIPSALVGIEAEGSIYRMDGVPLMLRKVAEPPQGVRTDVEILEMILREVKSMGKE